MIKFVYLHFSYVEGISWVLLYCFVSIQFQVYDEISPVLFLTMQTRTFVNKVGYQLH